MPFRVADRVRIGSVSDDERDPLPDDRVLEQRLEMASAIRAEVAIRTSDVVPLWSDSGASTVIGLAPALEGGRCDR